MKLKSILFLTILLLFGINVSAIELKLERQYLEETGQYNNDYLFSGKHLNFKGEANDVFAFSQEVDFSGKARLALISMAEQLQVKGTVGNGIKAAGRSVTINAKSTGTHFLAGETVEIGPEGDIKGDVFVGARKLKISGPITGSLRAGAGEVAIDNNINGNVEIWTGQLKISETGQINGNLVYHSDYKISDEEASRVTGTIHFEQSEGGRFNDTFADNDFNGPIWFSIIFKLAFAVLGFLVLLLPITRTLGNRLAPKEILSLSLWGLIPMFIYPSAFVISILLVITIPVALTLGLAFIPVLFITKIIGITFIGGAIATALNMSSTSRFLYFLLGVIVYSLLSLIPIFGFLLLIFVSSIGCGLLLFKLLNKKTA